MKNKTASTVLVLLTATVSVAADGPPQWAYGTAPGRRARRSRDKRQRRTIRRRGRSRAALYPSRSRRSAMASAPPTGFPAIIRRCPRSSRMAAVPTCAPARYAITRTARAAPRMRPSPDIRSRTSSSR